MSYFTASQIGEALAKARVSAGLSQVEIARRIEKGERTVQSWEKGCTSPDSDEIMDWCTACGVSPIAIFMEVLHPDLYKGTDSKKSEETVDQELQVLVRGASPTYKAVAAVHLERAARQQPACCDLRSSRQPALPTQQPGQRVRNHHQPIQLCPEHGLRPLPGRPTAAHRRFEGKLQGRT